MPYVFVEHPAIGKEIERTMKEFAGSLAKSLNEVNGAKPYKNSVDETGVRLECEVDGKKVVLSIGDVKVTKEGEGTASIIFQAFTQGLKPGEADYFAAHFLHQVLKKVINGDEKFRLLRQ